MFKKKNQKPAVVFKNLSFLSVLTRDATGQSSMVRLSCLIFFFCFGSFHRKELSRKQNISPSQVNYFSIDQHSCYIVRHKINSTISTALLYQSPSPDLDTQRSTYTKNQQGQKVSVAQKSQKSTSKFKYVKKCLFHVIKTFARTQIFVISKVRLQFYCSSLTCTWNKSVPSFSQTAVQFSVQSVSLVFFFLFQQQTRAVRSPGSCVEPWRLYQLLTSVIVVSNDSVLLFIILGTFF